MDKVTRALSMAEDNSIKLKVLESMTARFAKTLALSGAPADGMMSFGKIAINGPSAVIATYTGTTCTLALDGMPIANGPSPIIAVLDESHGELALFGSATSAKALVIGNISK